MFKNKQFKIGITGPFALFLVLVSIVPILLISGLFYKDIELKFNERINNLLLLGMMVAEDTYKNDLETLEYSTRQAASFSLSPAFQEYIASHNLPKLQKIVKRFQQSQNHEILALFNHQGKAIAASQHEFHLSSLKFMVEKSLGGKTLSSIERIYEPESKQYRLMYVAASPIFSSSVRASHPIGALLTGYSMSQHFSFKEILRIFPNLDIRVLATTPDGTTLRFSSSKNLGNLNAQQLKLIYDRAKYIHRKPIPAIFQENTVGEAYRTFVFPLLNINERAVGYIAISSSESDFLQLKQKNVLYITGFLVLVGLLIFFATYIFNRSIIKPVDELARVSDIVAQGDLSIRVPETQTLANIQLMMQNFNKMLSELEDSHLLRTTFVSTLTHDLRTPLFAQKRVLEALEKVQQVCPPMVIEMLDAIEKGNTQLLDMVNKLLEAYQYESGKISIYPEKISLFNLVDHCLEALQPLAHQKQIELHNSISPDFMVYADPEQLLRVFQNLIGNAIANIQAGRSVTIEADHLQSIDQILINDNGPGISPEVLPHLFQRYFTGHTKQKIGTGLGLFICRMIVELHQGTIQVESQLNQGSTFTITLPQDTEGI